MTLIDELAPCPFCGMTPVFKVSDDENIIGIVCAEGSPCRGSALFICFDSTKRDDAIAAWNRRAATKAEGAQAPVAWQAVIGRLSNPYITELFHAESAAKAYIDMRPKGFTGTVVPLYTAPQSLPDSAMAQAVREIRQTVTMHKQCFHILDMIEHRAREIAEGKK